MPKTDIYLVYGLTDAFRSTYVPPEEVERGFEGCIGKAIPDNRVRSKRVQGAPGLAHSLLVQRRHALQPFTWGEFKDANPRFRRFDEHNKSIVRGGAPGIALSRSSTIPGSVLRNTLDSGRALERRNESR